MYRRARITGSPFFRIVVAQVIATLLASASCVAISRVAALSALLAGLVCVVPGVFQLLMSLRPAAPGTTGLGLVVKGEAGRFLLTAVMFALVFMLATPLDAVVFFVTFAGLQVLIAIVPLVEAQRRLARYRRQPD